MFLELHIGVDAKEVDVALKGMMWSTSNVGLTSFLNGLPATSLRKRVEERFYQEGDSATGSWQPLKESTQQIRTAQGYSPAHPINIRTGQLRHFLVENPGRVNPTGIGAELRYPGTEPEGTTFFAFATAQKGSQKWGTPPRPVVAVDTVDLAATLALLGGFVVGGIQLIKGKAVRV